MLFRSVVYRGGIRTHPAALAEETTGSNGVRLIRSANHVRNFLDSVKSREQTICPIDDAVQADILCHVSDIATRAGRKVTWDPAKEQFVSDAESNRRLSVRPARQGWSVF